MGDSWTGGGRRDIYCASKPINYIEAVGPCGGDNGAALVDPADGSLIGMVTTQFVPNCGQYQFPAVFTNLNFHYDWIVEGVSNWSCSWFDSMKYPTSAPSFTMKPSPNPSIVPSMSPTAPPSMNPTNIPTVNPTTNPSSVPPSMISTKFVNVIPTKYPLIIPTKELSKKKNKSNKAQS